jgi:hypothetical protein
MDFPGIRIIDLDATELPSNNREILEVAIEWMFADPSILDAIMSVPLMPHQDEGTSGLAPPWCRWRQRGFSGSPQPTQNWL